MKKTYLSLAFLTLAVCLGASAQELTREVKAEHTWSAVAELSNGQWVVANKRNNETSFIRVDSTSGTAQAIHFGPGLEVYDMEKASMYFCGSILTNSGWKGVVGYLTNFSFTSGQVNYLVIDEVEILQKMVRYYEDGCHHLSMVGISSSGSHVVDVVHNPYEFGNTGWWVHSGTVNYYPCRLDGIAVTDSKVVLSGRNTHSRTGYLFMFDRGALPGTPFFFRTGRTEVLPGDPTAPVRVTGGLLDTCFAAYRTADRHLRICKYKASSLSHAQSPASTLCSNKQFNNITLNRGFSLYNICTDQAGTGLHLLVYPAAKVGSPQTSQVWHVPPSRMAVGGDIQAHTYSNVHLFTMARRIHQQKGIVASGERDGSHILNLYRLKSDTWGNCTLQDTAYLEHAEHTYSSPPNVAVSESSRSLTFKSKICTVENLPVNNICQ